MKRHAALVPLSHHHHRALVMAKGMIRLAEAPEEDRRSLARKVADQVLRFWSESGRAHFRNEEEVLLPAYSTVVRLDSDPDVMRLLADHASIRAGMNRLRVGLGADEDLSILLIEMGRELKAHIQLEEKRVFPRIENLLSDVDFAALARALAEEDPDMP